MVNYDQLKDRMDDTTEYGHYFAAWCPFDVHQSKALMVFKDGWFRCLSCGVSGDYSRLWSKLQGWEVAPAVRQTDSWVPPHLSDKPIEQESFCMEAHEILSRNIDTLGWYLKKRGVLGRVESCRLGWSQGWYTIPVYDKNHKFDGYVMRASIAIEKATGRRFNMPRNMGGKMYVPDWHLVNSSPYILVVYGMFDALALSELRLPVVTDTSGKKGFVPEWIDDQRKPVYIIPDKDEEDAARSLARKLGWRGRIIKLKFPEGFKDPAQFVELGKEKDLLSQICCHVGGLS